MEISDDDWNRFWVKVVTGDDDECWEWIGFIRNKGGYGGFRYKGKNYLTHVFSFLIHKGPTNGLCVCHQCDNPKCVNPAHLWLGTYKDNNDDKENKGRGNHPKGESTGSCKLTNEQVLEIREKYLTNKYSSRELGKQYNVSKTVILFIIKRITWTHI